MTLFSLKAWDIALKIELFMTMIGDIYGAAGQFLNASSSLTSFARSVSQVDLPLNVPTLITEEWQVDHAFVDSGDNLDPMQPKARASTSAQPRFGAAAIHLTEESLSKTSNCRSSI